MHHCAVVCNALYTTRNEFVFPPSLFPFWFLKFESMKSPITKLKLRDPLKKRISFQFCTLAAPKKEESIIIR